ncbi:MAG: exo-alpha-sialidase [Chloroflexi bacterium]|nr:exo-alpha-sialidase [Chloroflexota bacterium]
MRIEIERRNDGIEEAAGSATANRCIPNMARLPGDSILMSFRVGAHRESADGRMRYVRSTDEGRTWQDLGTPFGHLVPAGWDMRGGTVTVLPGAAVLTCVVVLDKSLDRPVYNPDGEGVVPIRNFIGRSEDGGRTWTTRWIDSPIPQLSTMLLLHLPSDETLLAFETFKEYDEPGPWVERSGVLRSADEGRTWPEHVVAATSDRVGDPHDTMWFDPRIARLANGRLVMLFYAFRHGTSTDGPNHISWSDDDGRTWSRPVPTTLWGQASYPIPLADGGLLVFQQRRSDPQVMALCYSADGGRTFDDRLETIVYRHEVTSAGAADGSTSAHAYLMSMARFTFGHPCGMALGPDRALLAWYGGSIERTAIHSAVVRVQR